ncbi:hypothetical protein Pan44_47510 [Caulifigura coniformis]|uniref:DUF306 domain-containing protein n=1 Tax=Caulifigura coniformis TaxID=2527983 RepID=A0A517SKQ6_9PLAN|nr:lipocalin family protein [Caulifigura coniformis]QDT56694.1 hypothetical protein Pan44_47510 [Caulifigura coniformis]
MEPPEQAPSTPPKRRRRRWLIAAFVLVLVSLASWWYWPRGDARFVGKWRCRDGTWTLRRNGLLSMKERGSLGTLWCKWNTLGDELIVSDFSRGQAVDTVRLLAKLINSQNYLAVGADGARFRVLSASASRIVLEADGSTEIVTLNRISE